MCWHSQITLSGAKIIQNVSTRASEPEWVKLIPGYDTRLIYVMPSGTSLYLGAVHRLLVCGSGTCWRGWWWAAGHRFKYRFKSELNCRHNWFWSVVLEGTHYALQCGATLNRSCFPRTALLLAAPYATAAAAAAAPTYAEIIPYWPRWFKALFQYVRTTPIQRGRGRGEGDGWAIHNSMQLESVSSSSLNMCVSVSGAQP